MWGDLICTLLAAEGGLGMGPLRLPEVVVGPCGRGGSNADVCALSIRNSLDVSTDVPISGDSTRSTRLPSPSGVRAQSSHPCLHIG